MSGAVPIVIYTRTEYRLCGEAKAAVHKVVDEADVTVDIDLVNVDNDEELREKYGERAPCVYIDSRPTFKFRVDADRLGEKLTAARE